MNELADIIVRNEDQIRTEWLRDMVKSIQRTDLISKAELEEQSGAVLGAVVKPNMRIEPTYGPCPPRLLQGICARSGGR
jgi:hypothetical protein